MTFCHFLETNLWSISSGTLTATSEASALPVEATQDTDRLYVWRSLTQTADQVLTRDLGAAYDVDFVAIANAKRQGGGTVKLYSGGTGGSPGAWSLVATIPAEDDETRVSCVSFASVNARHWKIEYANGVPAVADYAEAGYIGLGEAFTPSRACVLPVEWAPSDPSVGRSSVDGQQSYTRRSSFAVGGLAFKAVSESDLTAFRSLYRTVGRRVPIFFALDSSLANQQWLMRIAGDLTIARRHVPGYYDVSIDWTEAV